MTLDQELVISIPGEPFPKGSLKCIGKRGKVLHQLVEDNAQTKPWRDTVAYWVRRRWLTHKADEKQALGAEITFTLPRPGYHFGTGRNAGIVKDRYLHALPTSSLTGDIDKLVRLILDALQDTHVLPNDCQVTDLGGVRKRYVRMTNERWDDVLGYPGVVIRLYPIEDHHGR